MIVMTCMLLSTTEISFIILEEEDQGNTKHHKDFVAPSCIKS